MTTYEITDPTGKVHTRNSHSKVYTHAVVRQLAPDGPWKVALATDEKKAIAESRQRRGAGLHVLEIHDGKAACPQGYHYVVKQRESKVVDAEHPLKQQFEEAVADGTLKEMPRVKYWDTKDGAAW